MGTFYIAGVAGTASFPELLNGLVRRFGSQTALGKAIDISPSRLSRVIQGQHSLEVVNCLRLAEASGESPSVILRAAGKADVADLIERMYGAARPALEPAMRPQERDVIEAWQHLPGHVQENFLIVLRYARDVAIADDARGEPRTAPPPAARRRRQPGGLARKRAGRRSDAKP